MLKQSILLLCLIMANFFLRAQDSAIVASSKYSEIVKVDSVSKTELYNRVKTWIATQFKSAQNAIQLDDKEQGKIICKGNIGFTTGAINPGACYNGHIDFTLTIEVKDGKYRIAFEDITHEGKSNCTIGSLDNEPHGLTKGNQRKVIAQCYDKIVDAANGLKKHILSSKKEDW